MYACDTNNGAGIGVEPAFYTVISLSLQVLKRGTERGYCAMDFTVTGEKLASVGGAPDFMLTVWDWMHEKVVLHCKAFGQDVLKVCSIRFFNPRKHPRSHWT